MSKKEERTELYRLYDMQEAITNILSQPEYAEGRTAFDNDRRYQVWVIYHIERLGECSAVLREHFDYDKKHPELKLGGAQGMRRRLVHKYWETDNDLVWKAVEYLPELKELLDKLVAEKEQARDRSADKEESEKLAGVVLPYPQPKSRLEELANKRAVMRAEGKLEKQSLSIKDKAESGKAKQEKQQEKDRDL